MELEHRPYPYVETEANLLRQVKLSAAEGLFKSFDLLVGKNAREGSVRFEALLGVYTNALQYVKFLETSLAVSCLNTEFKDLKRMTDGKIQFKISVPTIAHSDGRRPNKQKQYIVMKTCNKHHIAAEIELSLMDLELLFAENETPLDYTEHIGAIKTITSALQFGVDALERGLVDTVLNVKIKHAPPVFILKTLADPTYTERGMTKTVKSDLVSMFKKQMVDHSFFIDKSELMERGKQYVMAILADMIDSVCKETVFRGVSTYTTKNGIAVDGVMETTDNVQRKLLTLLGQADDSLLGPAAYASYVVRGEDLVTAVSYGKVMRNFDQFMEQLVEAPGTQSTTKEIDDGFGSLPKTNISASVIQIGNKHVALESLQRIYNETQHPFPLNRRMQYSYYFPVGLHIQPPRYTTSGLVKGLESPLHQSVESLVVNKNNTVLCFNYQNALKSICHPRIHNPMPIIQTLEQVFPDIGNTENHGVRSTNPPTMNLYNIVYDYYDGKNVAQIPTIAKKTCMLTDDLLHPTNHEILRTEAHPLFDIYVDNVPGARAAFRATHRTITGNIPSPLAPGSLHDCRGKQLESATGLNHVIDAPTMEIVQETAFDSSYPLLCYVIEAMVHGQVEKFQMNIELISLLINRYWTTSGKLAFVNSFFFIKHICSSLGGGHIFKEAYIHYRKIYGELIALEQALIRLTGHDMIDNVPIYEYVSAITDPHLLPPFIYTNKFRKFMATRRNPKMNIGGENLQDPDDLNQYVHVVGKMEDLVRMMANIYADRNNEDHDNRHILDVGIDDEDEHSLLLEKLFYYVFLPVCSNGHVCGMGADYENIALTLTYNGPVYANIVNGGDKITIHLENGTLRDLLKVSDIEPTVDMIRILSTCYLTCPFVTQAVRLTTDRDALQCMATHEEGKVIKQTVLVNGFAAFPIADGARSVSETMFYPVPFHKFYCDPMVAATLHPVLSNYVTRVPSQRVGVMFNLPPTLLAEYEEWHKSPMLDYVNKCEPTPTSLSALMSMHLKLSAIGFITQSRNKIHPGIALTVVRTDEVVAENIMFSSRASTSMFIGRPTVNRREVRTDAVTFDINHELASLNTSLGYNSTLSPAHVAAVTTDMGIHCQDMFVNLPGEAYRDRPVHEYVKRMAGSTSNGVRGQDPMAYVGGARPENFPGLCHGQLATCEVILTPVTVDLAYFQASNNPRGRASCVISCDVSNTDVAEKFIYDHSIPDPAYEYRSTVNPWASQRGSLGDIMYNPTTRQLVTPGMYSPCKQFFQKETMLKNNRSFYTLVSEYASRLHNTPVSGNTDLQYVVIAGTDAFLEQPCQLIQEAFPTICASHRGLLDEYMSHKSTHAPVHMNHYLIEEVAPMKRILKLGNKTVH
ncbi:major capsid protein [Saguinine gammaherpesvirus 1]|uniref:Major capsid protein n=1 Tax=Saguinine gammaherpesvirus 1 TaxID=2169901 RepID=A0A9Q8VIL1_9GAMA|nr:major capsid protein [Saguinine gammaherpesvirus 1]